MRHEVVGPIPELNTSNDQSNTGYLWLVISFFVGFLLIGASLVWFGDLSMRQEPVPVAAATSLPEDTALRAEERALFAEDRAMAAEERAVEAEMQLAAITADLQRLAVERDTAQVEADRERRRANVAESLAGTISDDDQAMLARLEELQARAEWAESELAAASDRAGQLEQDSRQARAQAEAAKQELAAARAERDQAVAAADEIRQQANEAASRGVAQATDNVERAERSRRAAAARASEAEVAMREANARATAAEQRLQDAEAQRREADVRAREAETRSSEMAARMREPASGTGSQLTTDMLAQALFCRNAGKLNRTMLDFNRSYQRVSSAPAFSSGSIQQLTRAMCRETDPMPCELAFQAVLGEEGFQANWSGIAAACRF